MSGEAYHEFDVLTHVKIYAREDQIDKFVERFTSEVKLQFKDAVQRVELASWDAHPWEGEDAPH